jgi:hypothetical protein
MACQTAVVATATGGIPEVVVDGDTGLLVPIEQTEDGSGTPLDAARFSSPTWPRRSPRWPPTLTGPERWADAGRRARLEASDWALDRPATREVYAARLAADAAPGPWPGRPATRPGWPSIGAIPRVRQQRIPRVTKFRTSTLLRRRRVRPPRRRGRCRRVVVGRGLPHRRAVTHLLGRNAPSTSRRPALKDFAVEQFGTADKPLLLGGSPPRSSCWRPPPE